MMDPIATFAAWMDATDRGERAELADAYNRWITKGGYPALALVRNDDRPHDVLRLTSTWALVSPDGGMRRNVHRVNLAPNE